VSTPNDDRTLEHDGAVPADGGDAAAGTGRGRVWALGLIALSVVAVGAALLVGVLGRDDGAPPQVTASGARAGERVGTTVAVYVTLDNVGGADTLERASSPEAARVLVHGTDEVGIMRTSPSLEVPASSTVRLEPGGTHLMLEGVGRSLAPGDTVPVVLEFDRGATLRLEAPVVSLEDLLEEPPA
jgi:copper(I)-binding protein